MERTRNPVKIQSKLAFIWNLWDVEMETEHSGEKSSMLKLEKDEILNRELKLEGHCRDSSGKKDKICIQLRQIFQSTGSEPSD